MAERKPIVLGDSESSHIALPDGDRLPYPPISSEAGNTIEVKNDGLYASGGSGSLVFNNTNSINWDNYNGQINGHVSLASELNSNLRNLLEETTQGLGVYLRTADTASVSMSGDGTNGNSLRSTVMISTAPGNAIQSTPAGLYAAANSGPTYDTPLMAAFVGDIGDIAIVATGDTTKSFDILCTTDVPVSDVALYFDVTAAPSGTYFTFESSDGGVVRDYKEHNINYNGRFLKGTKIGIHDMVPGTPYNITVQLVIPAAATKPVGPYLLSGFLVASSAYNANDGLGVTLRELFSSYNIGFSLVGPTEVFPPIDPVMATEPKPIKG